ncbi:autophagy-related protein 16-1-like [Oppia nitens]|uniref:autophagy-related protein 16-1-like n=1 Tax=Oppia nitens TaxID=1686743 RepID=UPI0023DCA7A0|nr:autophagy-related protein 16-1-like [Oppia nitens]
MASTSPLPSSSTTTVTISNVKHDWKESIIRQLNERKLIEQKPFESVITFCNHLYERLESIRNENHLLCIEKEKLLLETNELKNGLFVNRDNNDSNNTNGKVLEKKLFELQSELTELHRTRGHSSQTIIDLKNTIESKDREKDQLLLKLEETQQLLKDSRLVCSALELRIQELDSCNQLLKDEHQALQMAFNGLENKYKTLDKDHNELVTRWMTLKATDAQKMNDENEMALKIQNEKLRKHLEEAAKEMNVKIDDTFVDSRQTNTDPLLVCTRIPNRVLLQFEAHDGEVNAIKWSPNGDVVATGGGDRRIKLWEINENSSVAILKGSLTGNNAAVTSIDLDQDLLLASSNDFASRVWTLSDMKLRRTLTGHSNKVLAVKFLGSNKVVSGSHDRTLKIWDLNRHACIRTLFAGSSCNDLVTVESKESVVASAHFDKRIRFWDTRSDSSANEILLQGKVTALDVSPDGYCLLSCVRDDSLKCLDLRQNQVIRTFCAEGFKVGCDWTRCKFSPDNQYIVAGSNDGSIYIWNASNGKVEQILKDQHNSTVITCCWNPNGSLLMSTDRNKKAIVWSEF